MTEKREGTHSQMFMLRVWLEDVGNGRTEIYSTLSHVLTGEIAHSRERPLFLQQKPEGEHHGNDGTGIPGCSGSIEA